MTNSLCRYTCSFTLTIIFIVLGLSLKAEGLPTFYHAAQFVKLPKTDLRDWTTHLSAHYCQGNANEAFNAQNKKTSLLNAYGYCNLEKLAVNLNGFDQATYPLTWQYLNPENGSLSKLGNGAGQTEFTGDFSIEQLDLELHQNLFYGFFLRANVPIKELALTDIVFVRRSTLDAAGEQVWSNFVADFDALLAEHQIKPIKTPFKKNDLSDLELAFGWQAYNDTSFSFLIKSLQGSIQLGLIIPLVSRSNPDHIFSLPLGHQHHWGINAHVIAQANLLACIGIGLFGGITTFFSETYLLRLKTDYAQNGWIMLQKSLTSVDQGSLWNCGGYIKLDHFLAGLSLLAGYTYVKQEQTHFVVKDENYLKNFGAGAYSQNAVANSDSRFAGWDQHAVHFLAQYDFGTHCNRILAPQVDVAYHLPIDGNNSFATDLFSGTLGLQFSWAW